MPNTNGVIPPPGTGGAPPELADDRFAQSSSLNHLTDFDSPDQYVEYLMHTIPATVEDHFGSMSDESVAEFLKKSLKEFACSALENAIDLDEAISAREQLDSDKRRLEEEVAKLRSELWRTNDRLSKMEANYKALSASNEELKTTESVVRSQRDSLKSELDKARETNLNQTTDLLAMQAEKEEFAGENEIMNSTHSKLLETISKLEEENKQVISEKNRVSFERMWLVRDGIGLITTRLIQSEEFARRLGFVQSIAIEYGRQQARAACSPNTLNGALHGFGYGFDPLIGQKLKDAYNDFTRTKWEFIKQVAEDPAVPIDVLKTLMPRSTVYPNAGSGSAPRRP